MKLGLFDLKIKPIGCSEFYAVLLTNKQDILFSWGNFETEEAALSSAIQSCKKIFGVAFEDTNKPKYRTKSKEVDATQWFPESKIGGISLISHNYYYNYKIIKPGDWIVNGSVITKETFKENYECI